LVDYDAAQEIIRFVGLARPEYSFGATNAGDAAEGFEVEPSLLSLVCRELNERRLALGLNGIGTDLLAGSRDKIIEEFYEGCLAGQPAPLRAFVEDDLLSDRGFRESVTLDTAHRVLSDGGVPLTALDEMVRRRLLRIEERSDVSRVEIIHDVLTPVIRRSRETRRLRQAEGAAAEREEALRREKQRVRRAYWLTAAMALLAVITIGVAWWGWSAKLEAERQRNLADQQRSIAEQQRIYAEQQQTFAEQQKKIAEQQRTAANDASKRAEENFTMAVTTADTMVSKVAERLRDIMGVPTDSIRDVLASAERAFDQIAAAAPKSQHLRWRRAAMLISFADTYQSLGDTTEALSRSQKAREIMLVLVNEDPGNAAWQQTLYNGHQRVGDVLSVQGDRAGALAEYRADLGISQRLAEKNPDSAEWQGALAASHQRVGDVLRDRGDRAAALTEYRADLGISQRLAEKDPGNAEWQRALEVSHENVGDVLRDQGDRAAALTEYRADLGISQRLAEKDPGNARWQSDLAISHHRVGDVLSDQGDRAGALTEYRAALRICQRLAEKDPGNAEWQRALEVSHEKVGDVLSDQGDRAAALTEYRADLSITQRLTEKDPSNTQWQHGLAISHQRMGDVLRDQGDRAAALTEYRAELDIAQRLAEKDPGNADWQRSLLLTHERIGLVAYQKNDPAAALDAFEKAEKLARHVNEMNPTAATSAADLAEVQAQLKAVRQKIAAPAVAGKHKK
jgi:tetratricopeptide (TPR) repeat protein